MSEVRELHFLLVADLRGFFFNPHRPDGVTFQADVPPVHISVKPREPEQDGSGSHHGLDCRVLSSRMVDPELWEFASALIDKRFKMYPGVQIELPLLRDKQELINGSGKIAEGFGVPLELYPPELQNICDAAANDLRSTAERFFKLLRWQQEIDGPHHVFEWDPALYWRTSPSGEYYIVGRRQQTSIGRSPAGIEWEEADERDFRDLWAKVEAAEPLGHELLREAQGAVRAAPRSALLLAASALEAGIKTHIARLAPETEWLMMEAPAPPVNKMLRDYLPQLHAAKGVGLAEWGKLRPLFKEAEELAKHRNKLTHSGEMPEAVIAKLPSFLDTVSDLLYILDVVEGNEWARHNVQFKTRALLDWPTTRRRRRYIIRATHPSMLFDD
ncbi:hypothetical protein [Bradyrhizobium valentinum]|uniref:hypothetical protein n=1 Tax=Bradyrhizobium valentinum TaxID=1518501 RepID=UPI0012E3AA25|nr:hypothetical protein [Bradyrhizobium valentinum]